MALFLCLARFYGGAARCGRTWRSAASPEPVAIRGKLASGSIAIADTAVGERLRFMVESGSEKLQADVNITRAGGAVEHLGLAAPPGQPRVFWSAATPQEPHEFEAELILRIDDQLERIPFRMVEPGHAH